MAPDAAFALKIAAVAGLVALIVAIVVASWGSCGDPAAAGAARRAAVHGDVERALGADTLVTYDQAKKAAAGRGGGGTADKGCAICLSDYAAGGELVRVLPGCGHFFHAGCRRVAPGRRDVPGLPWRAVAAAEAAAAGVPAHAAARRPPRHGWPAVAA